MTSIHIHLVLLGLVAPKRISQIELLLDRKESEMAFLDKAMLDKRNASDSGKLIELTKKREILEEDIANLVEEWDELEVLVKHHVPGNARAMH